MKVPAPWCVLSVTTTAGMTTMTAVGYVKPTGRVNAKNTARAATHGATNAMTATSGIDSRPLRCQALRFCPKKSMVRCQASLAAA